MVTTGFFIITDISGYTEFLSKSEIDHAQEAIQTLFDVQTGHKFLDTPGKKALLER